MTEGGPDVGTSEPEGDLAAWVAEHWRPTLSTAEWWAELAAARLSDPRLPAPWGRSFGASELQNWHRCLAEHDALAPPFGLGNFLVLPTLLDHASPDLVDQFVPNILNGQHSWCQLFSEPGAGSDLAGLQTSARRDGDEWIVTGQKVWTSGGQIADFGILVARTDASVSKHSGLTYFLIEMDQPGIQVRPLREMTGEALFNEVFIDEARIPSSWVVGTVNDGWTVTRATLRHERSHLGGGQAAGARPLRSATPGRPGGCLDLVAGSFAPPDEAQDRVALGFAGVVALAREQGRLGDPEVRQTLARVYALKKIAELDGSWTPADPAVQGVRGNLAKLRSAQLNRLVAEVGMRVLGAHGSLVGGQSMSGGTVQRSFVFSPAHSIYGGTDQIQRNIVGERGLQLPKEPDATRDLAFNQTPQNQVRR